jgi:hypothetical protein
MSCLVLSYTRSWLGERSANVERRGPGSGVGVWKSVSVGDTHWFGVAGARNYPAQGVLPAPAPQG